MFKLYTVENGQNDIQLKNIASLIQAIKSDLCRHFHTADGDNKAIKRVHTVCKGKGDKAMALYHDFVKWVREYD